MSIRLLHCPGKKRFKFRPRRRESPEIEKGFDLIARAAERLQTHQQAKNNQRRGQNGVSTSNSQAKHGPGHGRRIKHGPADGRKPLRSDTGKKRSQCRHEKEANDIEGVLRPGPHQYAVQDCPARQRSAGIAGAPELNAFRRIVHELPLLLLQPCRRMGAQHGKGNGQQQDVRLPPVIKYCQRKEEKKTQGAVWRYDAAKRQHIQPDKLKDDAQGQAQFPLPGGKTKGYSPEKRTIRYAKQQGRTRRPRKDKKKP